MGPEAFAEIRALILEHGRPVKDEDFCEDWRDFDWDHEGAGCPGWEATGLSEVMMVPFQSGTVFALTHCRCACRVHPFVTIGLEGTLQ